MSSPLEERIQQVVDEHVAPLVNSGGTPSASQAPGGIVGVYLGGKARFYPYGTINPAGDAPTRHTLFGLGSVTKTFTTAILGQSPALFGESVEGSLPEGFRLRWAQHPTFAELASFTGGINPDDPSGIDTQEEFRHFINHIPDPGSLPAAWNYSDTSIGLLGQTLMSMAGFTDFGEKNALEWYRGNLLHGLKMGSTVPHGVAVGDPQLAVAYAFDENTSAYAPIPYLGWCPWGTAGRMFSTAADMVHFIMAAVGVDTIEGDPVPGTVLDGIAQAMQPLLSLDGKHCGMPLEQACAWVAGPPDPKDQSVVVSKDGGVPGVSAYLAVNPQRQYGVILMLNMQNVKVMCPVLEMMQSLRPLAARHP